MSAPIAGSQRGRGVYLLPNVLTTGCLFSGFYAIVAAIDGNFDRAGLAIFAAMLFDGLDGRVARWTGTESAFGKEYDSLADMVAFGIAPAVIVYQWGLKALGEYGWAWGKLGWLAAFLYAVAAALRLARFNVSSKTLDRRFFEGLPSPSAAGLVSSMVWVAVGFGVDGLPALAVAMALTVLAGALMVSRLAYWSFKGVSPRGRISFAYVLIIPLIFVLIAIDPPRVCFLLACTYAASGIVVGLWRRWRRQSGRARRNEQAAADE